MADTTRLSAGTADGVVVGTDEVTIGGTLQHVQRVKLVDGADGGTGLLGGDAANGLDVDVTRLPALVANSGVDIGDVTVNNAAGSPVPVQLSDGSAAQTFVAADLDSGAGTATRVAVAIAVPASGGPAIVTGSAAGGLKVDLGADNDVTVTGTVTVDGSGVTQPVSHAALTELAAAIDTEVQVDVVGALPAGNNNIGDVDVASLPSTVHSADYDTGGGTDTTLAFGIAVPASGGAAVVPGDATAGLKVDLGADNDVTVTGTVTANLAAGTNNIGDVDILSIAAGDNNIGNVDVVSSALPTGASTLAEQQTQTTHLSNTATSLGVVDDWDNGASDGASVSGDVAHDGVDAGEPVKIGHKAIAHGANPSAVAANDRTDSYANRHGIPWVLGGHPNVITKHLNITDADGAQTDAAIVTVSAGNKIVVTHITVTADGANTGDTQVRIGFGTANTPANDANAGVILSHPGVKAGSGIVIGNGGGIIGVGADNEDLRITCEDPAGGALDVVVGYFTIES